MKKEMLSAMMAIDDLLNANQLHLQVLAITPAIIVFYWLYNFYQTRHNFIRQALQLEMVQKESQSIRSVYHELFIQLKEIDCMLLFSERNDVGGLTTQAFGKLLTKVYSLLHLITCHETTLSKKHGIDILKFFKVRSINVSIILLLYVELFRVAEGFAVANIFHTIRKSIQRYREWNFQRLRFPSYCESS